MSLITAAEAKQIANDVPDTSLEKVLVQIKIEAVKGKTELHLYEPLTNRAIETLKALGYNLPVMPSIATQKDGLYHSIYWK